MQQAIDGRPHSAGNIPSKMLSNLDSIHRYIYIYIYVYVCWCFIMCIYNIFDNNEKEKETNNNQDDSLREPILTHIVPAFGASQVGLGSAALEPPLPEDNGDPGSCSFSVGLAWFLA